MKGEKLQDAIGMIDEEMIKDAENVQATKPMVVWWQYASVAAVLVVLISIGVVFLRNDGHKVDKGAGASTNQIVQTETEDDTTKDITKETEKPTQIVENDTTIDVSGEHSTSAGVENPTASTDSAGSSMNSMAVYEAVYPKGQSDLFKDYQNLDIDLSDFYGATLKQLLVNTNGENKVYSPVNLYMMLCMMAEVTNGNSRQQLLDLIGAKDINQVRTEANAVWEAIYSDDGQMINVLANSVWLDNDVEFNADTLKNLSNYYYASAYTGDMGTKDLDEALKNWINAQTGNLLKDQVKDICTSEESLFALASTVYYRGRWRCEFDETVTGTFRGSDGEQNCDFMKQDMYKHYYWGENFSAVAQNIDKGGDMWFILPDEGVSVDELVADAEVLSMLNDYYDWENQKYIKVNMSVPKFDVAAEFDMEESLKALGVRDIFDCTIADFSPMSATEQMEVAEIEHGARVAIDEEGCIAAAYTVAITDGATMPEDGEVDFVLDRPFMFVITQRNELVFAGVVNQID